MGIELPLPQGEHANGQQTAETQYGGQRIEQHNQRLGAEVFATEAPSFQEAKSGFGIMDASAIAQPSDAYTTTQAPQPAVSAASVSLDDVPVIAADEDLIEKQWVDSVKRIIKDTRDDPFMQGQAIGRLQTDYLQKRYGKSLPGSDGDRS